MQRKRNSGSVLLVDWSAVCRFRRAAKRAVAGQPPRRWLGEVPLGGRVEGRGTTREVVAGDAQLLSATGGQAAKKVSIGDPQFK